MTDELKREALAYHAAEPCGKLQILPTKPMATQRDLALAYSPGVAYACEEIAADPATAALYTGRANLVAVISNGTAVLGLGNIGALASKPVMEGKAALFKKFSGIDVMDIEVDETAVEPFVEAIARLEPTFGGINLEDISAPACFEIEKQLKARMKIPVFHDDQHGTAIVTAAGILNALEITGRQIGTATIACNGAGAAAIACLNLLVSFGANKDNILVCDRKGVIHTDRADLDQYKGAYAVKTTKRTLADAMNGADIFLGLSAKDSVTQDMVMTMAPKPIIFAMANPDPEIRPELVHAVRDDAIVATGRSDYPNQVNNVLCFPFIFRGALDCGATEINEAMKRACAEAIAKMARAPASDVVLAAYGAENMRFGPDYIIPKPFDPRLMPEVASIVAQAAMDSGVASRPILDMDAYRDQLQGFVFRSGLLMKPVFDQAARAPKRVVFAEGETERVLHAASQVASMKIAQPILIGDADKITARAQELRLTLGDVRIVDPAKVDTAGYAALLHDRAGRFGVNPREALRGVRNDPTVLACLMLERGEADAAICGANGRFGHHLTRVEGIIGRRPGVRALATLSALVLPKGTFFVADAYVNLDPTAEEVADLTELAAGTMRRMGVQPRAALVSHANFGDRPSASSRKMREAMEILRARAPDFEVDGEMHADAALDMGLRRRAYEHATLTGAANLFVMPNADAAHISLNLLKVLGGAIPVGPILLGAARPVHIAPQSVTVRGLLNLAAIAVVEAQTAAPVEQRLATK
ncbi:NADP-dependent malic enzyme [Amaricoccus sp.]|uniref:NADP-dependent malic enzyme n=1 Tax=Amaricoccus sp. TaxID=1872485 RepID=UPI002636D969|nr:NADP-dependent malic enzyme [uncultured Amaricoccus sp.]